MDVILARSEHLEAAAYLFDQYRGFYQQPSNLEAAKHFLAERLHQQDSAIFLAIDRGVAIGFIQLYPSFSSVSMQRIWILNDLFVDANYRQQGVARRLMNAAEAFARQTKAIRIALATQVTNQAAQALYESLGYIKDEAFHHYALSL